MCPIIADVLHSISATTAVSCSPWSLGAGGRPWGLRSSAPSPRLRSSSCPCGEMDRASFTCITQHRFRTFRGHYGQARPLCHLFSALLMNSTIRCRLSVTLRGGSRPRRQMVPSLITRVRLSISKRFLSEIILLWAGSDKKIVLRTQQLGYIEEANSLLAHLSKFYDKAHFRGIVPIPTV
jgi:hypothetical protein